VRVSIFDVDFKGLIDTVGRHDGVVLGYRKRIREEEKGDKQEGYNEKL
jgi:hypothetical protein